MKLSVISLGVWLALAPLNWTASAATVVLNLRDLAGTAGESFEAGNSFTESGVTFTATATGGTGNYEADNEGAGVSGGLADRLDSGEQLTFTLTFSPVSVASVSLVSVDLRLVGSAGGGDAALVTTPDGSVTLETGSPNFNGTSDLWTTGGIDFLSTESIVVGAQDSIAVQEMTFDVTTVPEPSVLLLGFAGGFMLIFRRSRHSNRLE